jgi:hypothetical protein
VGCANVRDPSRLSKALLRGRVGAELWPVNVTLLGMLIDNYARPPQLQLCSTALMVDPVSGNSLEGMGLLTIQLGVRTSPCDWHGSGACTWSARVRDHPHHTPSAS